MKLRKEHHGDCISYAFYCPGCASLNRPYDIPLHCFFVQHSNPNWNWEFNGDMGKPTFSPSLLNWGDGSEARKPSRCHLFVKNGNIEYCPDCTHLLAGKTVPMEDLH
jgi:hypothetical protein